MYNENMHPNTNPLLRPQLSTPTQILNNKLATLLAVIISFQQKIEILRIKLCGHPNFSPQLYFKQMDRSDKGFIDTQDLTTFLKKSRPAFNIDNRYLKSLFRKLNQDDRVPYQRLTYFGYLNLIKPYFDTQLARDVLMRDTMAPGVEINLIVKKILQDLLCSIYVCVAEHQRVKQLIILGDIEQGGMDKGNLFNIYEILQIIKKNSQQALDNNINTTRMRNNTNINQQSQINPRTQTVINQISSHSIHSINSHNNPYQPQQQQLRTNIQTNNIVQSSIKSEYKLSKNGILNTFYHFINNNSQYQINKQDIRFLMAYLMCYQYMITHQKYLTLLFMPVCVSMDAPIQKLNQQQLNSQISNQINFLGYVHPKDLPKQRRIIRNKKQLPIPKQQLQQVYDVKRSGILKHSVVIRNPQIRQRQTMIIQEGSKLIDQQPRILINAPQNNNLQTPILQKFLRESKVLKNMSRYRNDQINEQPSSNSSAFVQDTGMSMGMAMGNNYNNNNNSYNNKQAQPQQQYLQPKIIRREDKQRQRQRQKNKDFNLQDVLINNSNLQRSQYYQNLSMRANIKDQPLLPSEIKSPRRGYDYDVGTSGILNNFLLR